MSTEHPSTAKKRGSREKDSTLAKLATAYRFALRTNPVFTKSVTSGFIASLGNLTAQLISPQGSNGKIAWRNVASFGAFGVAITGPVTHYLYDILDRLVPSSSSNCAIKRLAIDRLVFAPPYLLVFFFVIALAEGCSFAEATRRVRLVYWAALKMNWRIWTVTQYINFRYVPKEYRVLVANIVSFLWNIYLAAKR